MCHNCDLLVFVDASGDDGFKFASERGKGSSRVFAVAVLMLDGNRVPAAEEALLEIKKLAGVRPTDEIKFTTVRRSSKRAAILRRLFAIDCRLIFWVAIKERIDDPELRDPSKKLLLQMVQAFPVSSIPEQIPNTFAGNIRVYIDRQKMVGDEKGIQRYIDQMLHSGRTVSSGHVPKMETTFEDSRRVKLIQLADLFSGYVREFFENLNADSLSYQCRSCNPNRVLCKYGRTKTIPPQLRPLSRIAKLLARDDNLLFLRGLTLFPLDLMYDYWPIQCLVGKTGPQRAGKRAARWAKRRP